MDRRISPPPPGADRRATDKVITDMIEKLDALHNSYVLFTRRVLRALVIIGITTFIALAIGAVQLYRFTTIQTHQRDESHLRQDQLCVVFERSYLQQVQQLVATYDFLRHTPASERGTQLNKAIIAGVPKQEAQVTTFAPPAFCAPRNVGLSTPVPKVPKRPKDLGWLPPPVRIHTHP